MRRRSSLTLVTAFLVALAVAAGAYVAVVGPERSKADHLARQIAQQQTALATARRDVATGRSKQIVQVADILRLAKAMPASSDMPDVLLQLNSLAAVSGVTFESITPGAPPSATPPADSSSTSSSAASATVTPVGYQTQPISLIFEGTYGELTHFLSRLRGLVLVKNGDLFASGRLFEVDSMTFAEGEQKFPHLQASLSVETYLYTGVPTTGVAGLSAGTAAADTGSSTQAASDGSSTGANG